MLCQLSMRNMIIFPELLQQLGFKLQYHPFERIPYLLPPLCTIPEGDFLMGSNPIVDEQAKPDEYPQHSVWLPTYRIGKYPVTVAEYAFAMQAHAPGVMMPTGVTIWWEKQLAHPTWPVYGLTWYDALGYTRWLEHMTGQEWRLPTEAEWEKSQPFMRTEFNSSSGYKNYHSIIQLISTSLKYVLVYSM